FVGSVSCVLETGPVAAPVGRVLAGPRTVAREEYYGYVKRDLLRIATFSTLIFSGMLILKFVVGL
ncbi:MAG: hypothetical protein ACRDIB_01190, partial [Ardenticatenaceae bacterium]